MEEKTKKGLALGMTGLVGLAAGAGLVAFTGEDVDSQVQDQLVDLLEQYEAELEAAHLLEKQELIDEYEAKVAELKDALDNVEPEVVIEEKEVLVDNGNLDMVLEYMLEGNVSLVIDGLDEDELDLIIDRIVFLNDAKSLSEDFVRKNVKSYAEDKYDMDKELISDVYILGVDLYDANFEQFEEFGYKTIKADVKIAYRYDGGAFEEYTLKLEMWNDKVRFI